jgi:hypothetical protein
MAGVTGKSLFDQAGAFSAPSAIDVDASSREEPKVREANTRQNKSLEARSISIGSGL